jgi:hypothetical protein
LLQRFDINLVIDRLYIVRTNKPAVVVYSANRPSPKTGINSDPNNFISPK